MTMFLNSVAAHPVRIWRLCGEVFGFINRHNTDSDFIVIHTAEEMQAVDRCRAGG
jgi:hypothetical protein